MLRALLLLSLLAALSGCSTAQTQLEQGRSHHVEWIGERPLIDRSHLSLTFANDGRAHGNAGCNHWFAQYTQNGASLTLSEIGSTRKLCSEAVMEQERAFLNALTQVTHWDYNANGQLQLWPASGKPIRLWAD